MENTKSQFLLQNISNRRMTALESLVDFLSDATAQLVWLSDREEAEISRDWSAKGLNMDELQQYYQVGHGPGVTHFARSLS